MKFILPDLEDKSENCNACIDTFWQNFAFSHTKTAMLLISLIVVLAFAVAELIRIESVNLKTAFFLVMGFWTGHFFSQLGRK